MIRLTVMYNLPPGADEQEFIAWRLGEHQRANQSIAGVVRTDFARITDCWPETKLPDFRFQTMLEWPDRASFERGFLEPSVQTELKENLKKLGDYCFFVSETLAD